MTPFLSAYLDGMRVLAALSVLIYHCAVIYQVPEASAGRHGEDAVIVFFVISGFVIAYATERSPSWKHFAFVRATRVYSVGLPALLLALAITPYIGTHQATAGLEWTARSFLLNLLFLNWSWANAVDGPNISTWWSLTYEVWYYALFGALTFLDGRRRVIAVFSIALVAGPKIILLLPCWWFGVLAFRHWRRVPAPAFAPSLICLTTAMLYFAAKAIGARELLSIQPLMGPLWDETYRIPIIGHSLWFTWDYFLAAITALHIAGIARITSDGVSPRGAQAIQWCAGATFSLYLTHLMFLRVFNIVFPGQAMLAIAATILAAMAFAQVFERPLSFWRRTIKSWFAVLRTAAVP